MNAVIYARYSCDNQREESIEGQLRECKEFAERKGIKLVGLFEVCKVKPPYAYILYAYGGFFCCSEKETKNGKLYNR